MGRVDCDPFPLQGRNWLESTEDTWEAGIYVEIYEHYPEFSVGDLRDIVKNGAELVNVAGGLVQAERQIQKIQMKKVQYARDFTEATQHLYPDISGDVMSIYTRGAMPIYHPLPAKPVPDDGYPHNPSQTLKIIEPLWGDIRQRKVILRPASSLIYGGDWDIRLLLPYSNVCPIGPPVTSEEQYQTSGE